MASALFLWRAQTLKREASDTKGLDLQKSLAKAGLKGAMTQYDLKDLVGSRIQAQT